MSSSRSTSKIVIEESDSESENEEQVELPELPNLNTVEGDLLEADEQYIVHQVNAQTNKGLGLSASLFKRYPYANVYSDGTKRIPGQIIVRKDIINLVGQDKPGKATKKESAEKREGWFQSGLDLISQIDYLDSVAFPYGIGSGLAGGNWENYYGMIYEFARANPDVKVVIYRLDALVPPEIVMSPKKTTKSKKNKDGPPTVVCVNVKNLRPAYNNLKEWMQDPDNVYIGRKGVVFIDNVRYPPEDSIWANPYKIKDYVDDEHDEDAARKIVLKKYRKDIEKNQELLDRLPELRGKTLGCYCDKNKGEDCHGDILVELYNKYVE